MIKHAVPILLAGAGAAQAHPGHEAAHVEGPAHWLGAADHWIVLALAALVAAEIGRRALRARAARRDRQKDPAP